MTRISVLALTIFLMGAVRSQALILVVPEDTTYRYVNATAGTSVSSVPTDWFSVTFDDSSWYSGNGPFGNAAFGDNNSNATGPGTPNAPPFPPSTSWSTNYEPYLRTSFVLSAPTALTMWIAVDNGIDNLYFNGVDTGIVLSSGGAAVRWEYVFDIPAAYTVAGRNTVALKIDDYGFATGFAMVVTTDDPTSRQTLLSGPVAIPVGAGCGMTAPRLRATPPILGGSVVVTGESFSPLSLGGIAFSVGQTSPLPIGAGCTVYIDPLNLVLLAPAATDGFGGFLGQFPVPNEPILIGVQVVVQAYAFGPGGTLELSNGILLTF